MLLDDGGDLTAIMHNECEELDDETKKMLAAATGKDPAAIEKAAAAKAAKGEQEGVPHASSVLTED